MRRLVFRPGRGLLLAATSVGTLAFAQPSAGATFVFQDIPNAGSAPMDTGQQTALITDAVKQDETRNHPLQIDRARAVQISVTWVEGALDMTLVDPNGKLLDPVTVRDMPNVEFGTFDNPMFGFRTAGYAIGEPIVGEWTVEVTGIAVEGPGSPYFIRGALVDPDVTLEVRLDKEFYKGGEPVTAIAILKDRREGISDAAVELKYMALDSTIQSLPMSPSQRQSGTYAATLRNPPGPLLNLAVGASGHTGAGSSRHAFSREVYTGASIASSTSAFTRNFHDAGIDTDRDGLFDRIRISIEVNISKTGQYWIRANLQDASGADLGWQRTDTTLAAGLHTIEFLYDCDDVYTRHTDGAFVLTDLILFEEGQVQIPVEEMPVAYRTRAYGFKEFQHQAVAAYDIQSSRKDADGDGRFETLTFRIHFDAEESWSCSVAGSLRLGWKHVGQADQLVQLSRGQMHVPVDLAFDGTKIRQAGGNGRYVIDLTYACGRDGPRGYLNDVAMSAEYSSSDFE